MMDGYFNFNRKLLVSPLWLSEKFTRGQAWIDLIGLANYKPSFIRIRGNRVDIGRGQLAWSELSLADRWQWSRGKVRRFLTELESENEQKIVQQKSNLTTLINIVNYDLYQGIVQQTDNRQDNRRYTDNKGNKNNNIPYSEIVSLYHEKLPLLSRVVKLTETRKRQIKGRWFESDKTCEIKWWGEFFDKVAGIKFLNGENDRNWKADLEWLTKQSNFLKVLEDKYN